MLLRGFTPKRSATRIMKVKTPKEILIGESLGENLESENARYAHTTTASSTRMRKTNALLVIKGKKKFEKVKKRGKCPFEDFLHKPRKYSIRL
jgi:hypothetical protein